jgi:hypothetical protein
MEANREGIRDEQPKILQQAPRHPMPKAHSLPPFIYTSSFSYNKEETTCLWCSIKMCLCFVRVNIIYFPSLPSPSLDVSSYQCLITISPKPALFLCLFTHDGGEEGRRKGARASAEECGVLMSQFPPFAALCMSLCFVFINYIGLTPPTHTVKIKSL